MRSTDTWWHLRTGQLILERGDVPWNDWYTFTDGDNQWIDLHWLFQVQVALLYKLGGVPILVLAKAACLTTTVAIGWSVAGRRLPSWLKTACWAMPIICLSGRALVRPEMLTLIFLAVWLWIIFRLEEKPRRIWWLPVVQLLWTNSHGLFVLGPVVGATYVVDRSLRYVLQRQGMLKPRVAVLPLRHLIVAGCLTLLASLINPYFAEGACYPWVLYGELGDLASFENEPPMYFVRTYGLDAFRNVFLLSELGLWLVTAGSFVWLACHKRLNVMRLLLFAGFSQLAWQAARNTNVFSLVSAAVLCANIADVLRQAGMGTSTQVAKPEAAHPPRRWPLLLTCALLMAGSVCIVTNVWAKFHGEQTWFGLGERRDYYIHEASKFAAQPGFPRRAFIAEFGQAAVYIFHNAPDYKVFMDGRLNVVSPATEKRYFEIVRAIAERRPVWQFMLRDADGNLPVVILDRAEIEPINGLYTTPGWRLVFADATAAVFIESKLADKLELAAADPQPLVEAAR